MSQVFKFDLHQKIIFGALIAVKAVCLKHTEGTSEEQQNKSLNLCVEDFKVSLMI